MTTISAETILRTRNADAPDKVLSTLLLRYPRWIHAELMTHRVLSRNASSSRAIPIKKMIDDINNDPAVPLHWGKNQKGMQADEECNELIRFRNDVVLRETAWLRARDLAVEAAERFAEAGYHKQIANRLLEPFMHITVLVSATEWDNFLELRDHPDTEPHFQMLAKCIRRELNNETTIQMLAPGRWHLPFIELSDWNDAYDRHGCNDPLPSTQDMIKLSAARCASTSYRTVDGEPMTMDRAEAIFKKLVESKPLHASPFEHVAQVDRCAGINGWMNPSQHRNFVGFRQYRAMIDGGW